MKLWTVRVPRFEILDGQYPGLSEGLVAALREAACVCLDRHHSPPAIFNVESELETREILAQWKAARPVVRLSWGNTDDTTETGAYCLVLGALWHAGFVAIGRSDTRSGADFHLVTLDQMEHLDAVDEDFEATLRVEISGVSHGDMTEIRKRLKRKVLQAQRGESDIPAIACVVGFRERIILIQGVPPR